MASKTGINICGLYVVSINAMPFHISTLNSKNLKGRTESYFILSLKLNDHQARCLVSGYVELISTAVSSN